MGRILFDQTQDARVILLPSLVTVKNSFNWTLRYKTKCSELSTSFNNQLYQEKLQFQNLAFECTIKTFHGRRRMKSRTSRARWWSNIRKTNYTYGKKEKILVESKRSSIKYIAIPDSCHLSGGGKNCENELAVQPTTKRAENYPSLIWLQKLSLYIFWFVFHSRKPIIKKKIPN